MHTFAIKYRVGNSPTPNHEVGHYSQPDRAQELEKEVTYMIGLLQKRISHINLLYCSDFNRGRASIDRFSSTLGLQQAMQPVDLTLSTFINPLRQFKAA